MSKNGILRSSVVSTPEITQLEHGAIDPDTDVTGDDPVLTGKIAWAHPKDIRDYCTRLDQMEAEAE